MTARKPKRSKRKFGAHRGEFEVPSSFFDPLPEADLRAFEGEGFRTDQVSRESPHLVSDGERPPRRRKR